MNALFLIKIIIYLPQDVQKIIMKYYGTIISPTARLIKQLEFIPRSDILQWNVLDSISNTSGFIVKSKHIKRVKPIRIVKHHPVFNKDCINCIFVCNLCGNLNTRDLSLLGIKYRRLCFCNSSYSLIRAFKNIQKPDAIFNKKEHPGFF